MASLSRPVTGQDVVSEGGVATSTDQLLQLGWRPELDGQLEPALLAGRVSASYGPTVDVHTGEVVTRCHLPARLRRSGVDVAVGDWVGIAGETVQQVLPRTSAIVRHAAGRATTVQTLAANVDLALVVTSFGPDLDPRRIERYLAAVGSSGAMPEIILTKADRMDDHHEAVASVKEVALGVPVHVVSGLTGAGCDEVRARITPGTTAVLLGSSGVGKSTLVNRFAGATMMDTGPARLGDDKGRHTTTGRQLILLPAGGLIIDTPGLRELQLWGTANLENTFSDIDELAAACRFGDCAHSSEPGCAVLAAVRSEQLSEDRIESWRKLQREVESTQARSDMRLQREGNRREEVRRSEARTRGKRRQS